MAARGGAVETSCRSLDRSNQRTASREGLAASGAQARRSCGARARSCGARTGGGDGAVHHHHTLEGSGRVDRVGAEADSGVRSAEGTLCV